MLPSPKPKNGRSNKPFFLLEQSNSKRGIVKRTNHRFMLRFPTCIGN
ncbi:hypothetical protein LEP1GSC196_0541 [Leptospira meyeri serovar Semaranga str. Veldrot Semarang 173]|nr:hypothetical protein LEP1GSC196_0541 [Leptospira meyeri serovar Semaranga str. Veldrot Semarang 173]